MTLFMPGGALVHRELIASLRKPRSFVVVALFVGACIAGIGMSWPEGQRQFMALAELSEKLVRDTAMLLFAACVIFVPALAAGAIVVEREQETLDLLRAAPVRPTAMLLAKLLSVIGFFMVLLVAAVPVFAVAFFLIGLDWLVVAEAVAVLVATAASCAAAGLLSSASNRRTARAVFGSYLGVLFVMAAAPIAAFVIGVVADALGLGNVLSYSILRAFAAGTPYGALASVLSGHATVPGIAFAVGLQLLLALFFLALARRYLVRPLPPPKVERFKPIDDPYLLRGRKLSFPFYLVDPLKRKKPIEDGRNPMFVRELRWGLMDRASTLIRMFYTAFLGYLLVGAMGFVTRGNPTNHSFMINWLLAQIWLTVAVAPALIASTLAREYESGNIDMLRTTLLTPGEIVRGKLFAGMSAVSPLVLAAVGSSVPLLPWITDELGILFTGYVTLMVCATVCLALGLFASLLTTHTTTALVLTYLFTLVALLGTWGVFLVLPLEQVPLLSWLKSPILVFIENGRGVQAQDTGLTLFWCGNVIVFGSAAAAVVYATIQGFARYRLRDV